MGNIDPQFLKKMHQKQPSQISLDRKVNTDKNPDLEQELKNIHYSPAGKTFSRTTPRSGSIDGYQEYFGIGQVYDDPLLDKARARNQSGGEQAWNAVAGTALNIIPRIVGDFAAMLDFEDYSNTDNEVGNWLTKATQEWTQYVDEDLLPIYRENPEQAFDWGDPAYWFSNGRMLAESAIPFIVEGYVTGGVASSTYKGIAQGTKFARALAKTSDINKATRLSKFLTAGESQAVAGMSGITNAVLLNQAESIGSAMSVFDQTYKGLVEQGLDEEKARQKAADAAAYSVNINRANILLNLSSAGMFVKNPWSTRALVGKPALKNTLKKMGFEGAQEWVEETVNYVSEKAGVATGLGKEYTWDDAIADASSEHGLEAGFLGMVGGIVQTGGTIAAQNLKSSKLGMGVIDPETGELLSTSQFKEKRYNEQAEKIQLLEEAYSDPNILPRVTSVFKGAKDLYDQTTALKKALEEGNEEAVKEIQQTAISNQALIHFETGTTEKLLDFYERIKQGEPTEGMDSDPNSDFYYKKRAQQAIDSIKQLEKEYVKSKGFINSQEIYNNRSTKIFKKQELHALSNLSLETAEEANERILSLQERGKISFGDLLLDANLLQDEKFEESLDKESKKIYNKVLKELIKDPAVIKHLSVKDEINSIKEEIYNLDDSYYDITSGEVQDKLRAKAKVLEDEVKEIYKEQKRDKRRQESRKAKTDKLSKMEEDKEIKEKEAVREDNSTIKPVFGSEISEAPTSQPPSYGSDDPSLSSTGRQNILNKGKLSETITEQNNPGERDQMTVQESKDAYRQAELESQQFSPTQAQVFTDSNVQENEVHLNEADKDLQKDISNTEEINEDGSISYDYSRSKTAHNKLAYKAKDYNKIVKVGEDGITSVTREDFNNLLSDALMSKVLLDPDQLQPGETITLRPKLDDDQEVSLNGEIVKYGSLSDGMKLIKAPIVIDYKGEEIAFLHDVDWINSDNVSGDIIQEQAKLQQIRSYVLTEGEVKTKISFVNNGKLLRTHNGESLPTNEAMPDKNLELAVGLGGELTVSRDTEVNNKFSKNSEILNKRIPNGVLMALAKVNISSTGKDQKIGIPLRINRMSNAYTQSVSNAVSIFAYQNETGKFGERARMMRDQFEEKTGLNLFEVSDLRKYINRFIYADFQAEKGVKLIDYLKLPGTPSDLRMVNVNTQGVEWGRGKFKGDHLRNITPSTISTQDGRVALPSLIEEFTKHIKSMYIHANLSLFDEKDFKLPLITEEGIIEGHTGSYKDFLKNNTTSDVFSVNIGTEENPKYAYTIQRTIEFDTKFLPESKNPLVTKLSPVSTVEKPIPPVTPDEKALLVESKADQMMDIVTEKKIIPQQEQERQQETQKNKEDISKTVTLPNGKVITINKKDVGDEEYDMPMERSVLEAIQEDISTTLLIPGLTTARQQTLIDNVALDINARVIEESKISVKKAFDEWYNTFEDLLLVHESLGNNIQQKDLNSVLDNWDMFKVLTMDYLSQFSTLKITEDITDEIEEEENGGDLSKTNWGDDGTLMVNSKDTISAKLKKFLANIVDVDNQGKEKTNYIGLSKYIPFDTVYNTVSAKLGGDGASFTRADFDTMMEILENSARDTPFLYNVVNNLRNANQQIKNEFVVAMAKHYVRMKTVLWSGDNSSGYTTTVIDTNANSIAKTIESKWNNNLISSELFSVREGEMIINQGMGEALIALYDSWVQTNSPVPLDEMDAWLSAFGIDLNENTLNKINTNGLYVNGKKQVGIKLLDKKIGVLGILSGKLESHLSKLKEGSPISLSDLNPLDDTSITALSKLDSKFSKQVFSTSHKDGEGKTIYSFTQNKYAINRYRDLILDNSLLENLKKIPFIQDSIWADQLSKDSVMREVHQISYLDTIRRVDKRGKGKKLKNMSKAEHELTKLAFFQNKGTQRKGVGEDKVRIGSFMYPTMSDKTTMLVVQSVLHNTKLLSSGKISPQTIDAVYRSLVLPEVKRIIAHQNEPITHIEGYDEGASMFMFLPELNNEDSLWDVLVDEETGERERFLKEDVLTEVSLVNKMKEKVEQYLEKATEKKLQEWSEMGIQKEGTNIKFMDNSYIKNIASSENTLRFAAVDFIANSMIANANIFQLYIGDPAQFYKKQNSTVETDYVGISQDTFINIGKRLAGDIAPGVELANSEKDTYRQAFISDRKSSSVAMDHYNNILKDYAKDYESIEGTDAQEFTTWAEHIDILYNLGKLTEDQYDSISKKLLSNKELSKSELGIVMQPLKPVFVKNIIEKGKNGEPIMDRRIYIKSSSFPLLPQLTSDLEIDKLRIAMEKEGVDRVAFSTAVKVGNFNETPQFFEEGDSSNSYVGKDNFSFGNNILTLPRNGFRIQQEVPFDSTKDKINDGTQQMKLLFLNILDVENFEYKGEKYSGRKLKSVYDKLYENLFKRDLEILKDKLGVKNNKPDLKKVQKILITEAKKRNYPINDILSLELDENGNFVIPIWASTSASKFESLLNSLVDNDVRKKKTRGSSFVLGTEEGFKSIKEGEEGQVFIDQTNNIIFTPSWDGYLKPQRIEDGVVKPAQILIPNKLRDQNGRLVDLKKFVGQDGRLSFENIDPKILNMFGFRIPTQGFNSMSYMEVVGFLPETVGDLIIAPRDWTKQMGSDFDIDKLYTYMFNTYIDKGALKIYNRENFISEDIDEKILELNNNLTKLQKEEKDISFAMEEEKFNDLMDLVKQGRFDEVVIEDPEAAEVLSRNKRLGSKIRSILQEMSFLYKIKSGKVFDQNDILNIHFSILSNPDSKIQKQISKPLDFGDLKGGKNLAETIYNARRRREEMFNPLGPSYQRDKFMNATAGKAGVGTFSNDSTFNALVQDKEIILGETVWLKNKSVFKPLEIKFGNDVSDGNLSNPLTIKTQKGKGNKYKSDVIAAYQSAAVDNEKEQILDKVNINSYTFDAIKVLNQLGFEEDVVVGFISQDIIFDYVNELIKLKDSTNETKISNPEDKASSLVISKYESMKKEGVAFDQKTMMNLADVGADKLLSMIKEGGDKDPNSQIAIMYKFKKLTSFGRKLKSVQSAINSDSAGIGKSLFHSSVKEEQIVKLLNNKNILNAHKLIGEYYQYPTEEAIPVKSENGRYMYIKPTSISGFAATYGLATNNRLWEELFPYQTKSVKSQLQEIEELLITEDNTINEIADLRSSVWGEMKSFLFSNPDLGLYETNNIRQRRGELFFDIYSNGEHIQKSLATKVKEALDLKELAANPFLNKLTPEISKISPSIIKFLASSGENFDEKNIYVGFTELIVNERKINEGYTTRDLASELIEYAYLEGGIQKAIQFVKFVPPAYLKKMPFAKKLSNIDFRNLEIFGSKPMKDEYYDTGRFTDQYMQHHPWSSPLIMDNKEISSFFKNVPEKGFVSSDFKKIKKLEVEGGADYYPTYVTVVHKNGPMLFKFDGSGYNRIDVLGVFGMSEYDYKSNVAYSNIINQHVGNIITQSDGYVSSIPDTTTTIKNIDLDKTDNFYKVINESSVKTLENISLNSSLGTHRNLSDFLLSHISDKVRTNIIFDEPLKRGNAKLAEDGNWEITIWEKAHSGRTDIERTILHEMVHVATIEAINSNPKISTELNNIISKTLDSLSKEEKVQIKEMISNKDKSSLLSKNIYGLYNNKELIAEALTNPEFQKILKGVPYEGDKSLWEKIMEKISELFNSVFGEKVEPNALSAVFDLTIQLLEQQTKNSEFNKIQREPGNFNPSEISDLSQIDLPLFGKEINKKNFNKFLQDKNIC